MYQLASMMHDGQGSQTAGENMTYSCLMSRVVFCTVPLVLSMISLSLGKLYMIPGTYLVLQGVYHSPDPYYFNYRM